FRNAAGQAHVGDGRQDAVRRYPVDAGDDDRERRAGRAAEHPHAEQAHVLGDSESRAADGARDMRSMAYAVVPIPPVANLVDTWKCTAAERGMGKADAGVDDVNVDPGAVEVPGVIRVERQVALVDAVKPPGRRVRLCANDRGLSVLLDQQHLRITRHRLRLILAHLKSRTM